MLVEIRRVRLRSVFLVTTTLYAIVGFLVGLVLAVVATLEVPEGTEPTLISRLGIWSIVLFPVLYGLGAGFLAAVAAALYNSVAALVGGIRVEVPDLRPTWHGRREEPEQEEGDA
ncbi:MAG: hypothetical protein RRA92_02350 [Gemmatimonadota bacterium]|nr:hypothetical protein [Gemmatimonadota bacterium]